MLETTYAYYNKTLWAIFGNLLLNYTLFEYFIWKLMKWSLPVNILE